MFLSEFGDLEPQIYLPFDEEVPFQAPGLEKHGKFYLLSGIAGEGLRFDDGWMSMDCPDLTDGLTFMTWMRVDSLEKPVYVFSSRSPDPERGKAVSGVHMSLDLYFRIMMNDKTGKNHCVLCALPEKLIGDWVHYLVSIDLKAKKIRVWINFVECVTYDIPEDTDFDLNARKIYIAQDATEHCSDHIPAVLDDFCLFRQRVTDRDVDRICDYYKG